MRQLFELIPIILFFITYKMSGETISIMGYTHTLDGIFSATAVLMIASTIQMALTLAIDGKIKTSHLWLYALVIVAGSATIYLRDPAFIKWKPTVFNWGMAIVLYGSLFLSKKSILERMLGGQLNLPQIAWKKLNQLWIGNFLIVGALNLYVAYNFSENAWVDYKLYSAFGFTVLLIVLTMIIMMPYMKNQDKNNQTKL